MRFLCLHGSGTNSQIFEAQTAAIRYELGDHHTYEFVEGTWPTTIASELKGMAISTDEFFSYIDGDNMGSYVSAISDLDTYLSIEGPFDGVLAFSQGALLAATYIAWKTRQNPRPNPIIQTFKCAIFFSAFGMYDPDLLLQGQIRLLDSSVNKEVIHIPTAHIWGRDDFVSTKASSVSDMCEPNTRHIFIHEGGHEIPGVRMNTAVKSTARIIRRVILLANTVK
ncbi:serine hydrolase FSH [Xylariaceae sp. FL0662B]|nr:serine hydrolase FSH [Xylariaceae sp. FL0662B]